MTSQKQPKKSPILGSSVSVFFVRIIVIRDNLVSVVEFIRVVDIVLRLCQDGGGAVDVLSCVVDATPGNRAVVASVGAALRVC